MKYSITKLPLFTVLYSGFTQGRLSRQIRLSSLIVALALIFPLATAQVSKAVDFYATNVKDKNLYGINIDGSTSLIGPFDIANHVVADIAVNPVNQTYYTLAYETTNDRPADLYSTNINASGGTNSLIGRISSDKFTEGGLAFSSFQGTNQLYSAGLASPVGSPGLEKPTLYSINTLTGAGTIVSSGFLTHAATDFPDVQSIWTAPNGSLWGLVVYYDTAGTYMGTNVFRFKSDGTVDQTVTLTGFLPNVAGGVTVKNGVTYYLTTPTGLSVSNFGTLTWDTNNNIYTGGVTQISNTIIGGMTGLVLAPASVPEPSTYALGAIATGVMALIARRRKAARA